jgi:hypothetical protein
MAKRTFWVLIETDTDRFANPDKADYSDIQEVLRNEGNYGIVDFLDEADDLVEIILK